VSLLEEVLDAHGGAERWARTRRISARVRTGGLLPRTRMPGNRFADVRVTVDAERPLTTLEPFPGPGRVGVFEGGEVRIQTADGEVLDSRADARGAFSGLSGLRRNLRWDALDSVYFAGYANLNYLTTPFLLAGDGFEVSEGDAWEEGGEVWQRLEVTFPEGFDTHSRRQTFYFDALHLLRRHDYVAEPIGRWARAAHYCDEHARAGGLVFPTRRRVRPIGLRNRALGFPTLVSLDLSEIEVEAAHDAE
jgi:hypothetical protein